MRRVVGPLDAAVQHRIVARVLALLAQALRGEPDERVEPVRRPQTFGGHLREPVAAADVRELVQEHDAHAIVGPLARRCRQDDSSGRRKPQVTSSVDDRSAAAATGRLRLERREISAASSAHFPSNDALGARREPGEASEADGSSSRLMAAPIEPDQSS